MLDHNNHIPIFYLPIQRTKMFVKNDHRPEIHVFHVLRIRSITAAETQAVESVNANENHKKRPCNKETVVLSIVYSTEIHSL